MPKHRVRALASSGRGSASGARWCERWGRVDRRSRLTAAHHPEGPAARSRRQPERQVDARGVEEHLVDPRERVAVRVVQPEEERGHHARRLAAGRARCEREAVRTRRGGKASRKQRRLDSSAVVSPRARRASSPGPPSTVICGASAAGPARSHLLPREGPRRCCSASFGGVRWSGPTSIGRDVSGISLGIRGLATEQRQLELVSRKSTKCMRISCRFLRGFTRSRTHTRSRWVRTHTVLRAARGGLRLSASFESSAVTHAHVSTASRIPGEAGHPCRQRHA